MFVSVLSSVRRCVQNKTSPSEKAARLCGGLPAPPRTALSHHDAPGVGMLVHVDVSQQFPAAFNLVVRLFLLGLLGEPHLQVSHELLIDVACGVRQYRVSGSGPDGSKLLLSLAAWITSARQSGQYRLFWFCILIMQRIQKMWLQSSRMGSQPRERPRHGISTDHNGKEMILGGYNGALEGDGYSQTQHV